eukprot:TRINITY_DN10380_c0_g1_i1.p1 TRINITY_DN10380_c0_g1~~TRINITY_DN10380_c0_g1_i1.p1  ORF type:complete len:252 (-),score=38.04 TRINITY_DN10380_c0_g1_i1:32-787(-)
MLTSQTLNSLLELPDHKLKEALLELNEEQKETLNKKLSLITSILQKNNEPTTSRVGTITRKTKETEIYVCVNLDGTGVSDISTGIGFLDHMFTALSKHGMIDISIKCKGDLWIDDHHTAEDCALALGEAVKKALGNKFGIVRYGYACVPLDEALSRCVVDIIDRPTASINLGLKREKVGKLSTEMITHVFQSFASTAGITLHVDVLKGENDHHRAESAFKSLALALRQAVTIDPRRIGFASTKGIVDITKN